jgi:hypothetical protein
MLQGCGAAIGLPFLECMAQDASATERPKRFCGVYFPYGVVIRKEDEAAAEWNWFPKGSGAEYELTPAHQSLESLRGDLTILGGLSHPNGRKMDGHDTADTWLTAYELKGGRLVNSVSMDQLIAMKHGDKTRFSSLVMSTDGGVGEPTRSSTLSFSRTGQPIPAMNKPRMIFDRLFGKDTQSLQKQTQQLRNSASMLDLTLEHSKSLQRRLGKLDQQKLEEYLESMRQIEKRVAQSERWLHVPKPQINATDLHLDADDTTPGELIRTMYDLIYLAFQTDSTRTVTYQLGNMNGATSIAGKFPQLLGFADKIHALAHGARKGEQGAENLGKWDQFLTEQLAYFLTRLKNTQEGDGNLLDHTMVLYGSSNSHTHVNTNYPLILSGGDRLGLKHGQFLQLEEDIPLSNLFVTMLNRLDTPVDRFVDSTSEIAQVVSS